MDATVSKFPFSAVAGLPLFKTALILTAINPKIGGVLISGPRGSAKSTLARGLAAILPGQQRFVDLPLGASEEMLIGTLDLKKVLHEQQVEFHPGLLAKANNGVLYVDEVNLLPDALVDLLLDVAASGVNQVERDGISHQHAARFVLVGTMNPDEGELRPQLQDRFGLSVELDNSYTIEERIAVVRLREAYEQDPEAFNAAYTQEQQQLSLGIEQARSQLTDISCDDAFRVLIAQHCHDAKVEGLRADIVWFQAAIAHAAWEKRKKVTQQDIDAVSELVLKHRRKSADDESSGLPPYGKVFSPPQDQQQLQNKAAGDWGSMPPQQQKTAFNEVSAASVYVNPGLSAQSKSVLQPGKSKGSMTGGVNVGRECSDKINWYATLLANVGSWPPAILRLRKARSGKAVLHLVLLDTSASTLRQQLFGRAKAVILAIAKQAYKQREQLSIVGFGNQQVSLLLPCLQAPNHLRSFLDNIPAAGGTPLREAVQKTYCYQQQLLRSMPELEIVTYLITDGKITQSVDDLSLLGQIRLLDLEQAVVKRGKGQAIAAALNADYMLLPV